MIQPSLTTSQIIDVTNYVNTYRAKNQAPPMAWDTNVATFSQQWSYHLSTTNTFEHSGTKLYGENLAMLEGYGNDVVALIKKSIDLWYNEISLYDFTNPTFSPSTGHFTCLVWKSSTHFGMGITMDLAKQKAVISMNTSPPGNIMGQFQDNVLPLINVPSPTPSPSPIPLPVPSTPMSKSDIIYTLNSIFNDLNRGRPKSVIMKAIQDLITKLNMSP